MKKILSIIALASSAIFSAHGALVYTTFNIPAGSSNVGSFNVSTTTLRTLSHLSQSGSTTRPYAYRYFTPSVTGLYTLGMTDADYDAVMILYSGQTSFPELNPGAGAFAINDDGDWDLNGPNNFSFGTQTVNPSASNGSPTHMPLIKDQSLTAGTNYLVAITTYGGSTNPLPLPASFFVAGGGAVTLDGATAAVPEPGQVAASLLLLGGIGGYVFLKRRKTAQGVSAPVAA